MKCTAALTLTTVICVALFNASPLNAQSADDIIDVADRAIHIAKQIKSLIVKQVDPADGSKSSDAKMYEIIAKDRKGDEVDVPSDEAKKIYKWTGKDPLGKTMEPKGILERVEEQKGKVKRTRNILRLTGKDAGTVKNLKVQIADKYSVYSSAAGTAKTGSWFGRHPVLASVGGVAIAGGAVAAGSSGGGDGSSSISSASSTSSSDLSSGSVSPFKGTMNGSWEGIAMHEDIANRQTGGSFSITISDSGAVTGSFVTDEGENGTLSGTVNDSGSISMSMFLSGEGNVGTWIGTFKKNGSTLSASGTWTAQSDSYASGTWTGTGEAS